MFTGWAFHLPSPRGIVQHFQISSTSNEQWHSTWNLKGVSFKCKRFLLSNYSLFFFGVLVMVINTQNFCKTVLLMASIAVLMVEQPGVKKQTAFDCMRIKTFPDNFNQLLQCNKWKERNWVLCYWVSKQKNLIYSSTLRNKRISSLKV